MPGIPQVDEMGSSHTNATSGRSDASSARNSFAAIRSRLDTLPPQERIVADFALRHAEDLLKFSITDLATRLHVSEATVIRFCKHLGYRGYHEFKILHARDLGREPSEIYSDLAPNDNARAVIRKTVRLSLQALQDTLTTLDGAELERASAAVARAALVVLFGVGGSGGIALVGQQRLLRLDIPVFACTDTTVFGLISARLHRRDVAIGISHSGTTVQVVKALDMARECGAATISLTNYSESPVTRASDIVLLTGAARTPLASEAGASRIAQLAAIDALCARIVLLQRRPSGADGRG